MAFKINNIELPYPKSCKINLNDLDSDNTTRNAAGYMNRDIIRKSMYKLELEFPPMYSSKIKEVLSIFDNSAFFNFTFFDPKINDWKTIEVYAGDRSMSLKILEYIKVKIPNTDPVQYRWDALIEGLSFSLIER